MSNQVLLIDKEEYDELLRNSEKIAAVERYVAIHYYHSADDIIALLGLRKEKEDVQR